MNLKLLVTSTLLFIGGIQMAAAQDKIYLRNGGIIDAKVKEVAPKTVTYTKKDNPDGPDFVIRKGEVESIKYANGSKDVMEADDAYDDDDRRYRRERGVRDRHTKFTFSKEKYGKNIFSFAPIQMANEGAVGVGLHYERVIDKNSLISFYLPYAMIIKNYRNYDPNNNTYDNRHSIFNYFYPGIKLYPTGSNRRVSYAVGVAAALGFGNKYDNYYNQGISYYEERSVFKAGALINNSLNVQPTKHIYLGVELGLGFTYYDESNRDSYGVYYDNDEPLVQFNFKIGYRF